MASGILFSYTVLRAGLDSILSYWRIEKDLKKKKNIAVLRMLQGGEYPFAFCVASAADFFLALRFKQKLICMPHGIWCGIGLPEGQAWECECLKRLMFYV